MGASKGYEIGYFAICGGFGGILCESFGRILRDFGKILAEILIGFGGIFKEISLKLGDSMESLNGLSENL
ncbi:hypothetical protein CCY99_08500 [Helicobacter sp. 16-1353]|uniref:hypothetical protein n=1 Tax=Helicobacter sp. 16-1353 TaxID=2004996 RepID=UPI000DCE36A2|nr:hypothetical protein [Helicobacter sp. 16-1353]RAX51703.1 hypothetical protein CCY99_08500 [Helicobacter sp. 16-1353]